MTSGLIDALIDQRGRTHGDWRRQAPLAQKLKRTLLGDNYKGGMTPQMEEGLEMICVKLARIVEGDPHHAEHWRDVAGYATLVADTIEGDSADRDVSEEETPRPPIPKIAS